MRNHLCSFTMIIILSLLRMIRFHYLIIPCQVLAKIIMLNILPKSGKYGKARGCVTLLINCIMSGLSVNLLKLIFDNMTAENFEHKNLPYNMILTIFFEFWGVNFFEEAFVATPCPFDHSFINRILSHLFKSSPDDHDEEEEEVPEP